MFESIISFFKNIGKTNKDNKSKDAAKERLHLVLMQDRANISADFLSLMKQEIIEVIKKYIDVDENAIDVRLTNKANGDGTTGAPVLYANIPIVSVREEAKEEVKKAKAENSKIDKNTSPKKEFTKIKEAIKTEKKEESKKANVEKNKKTDKEDQENKQNKKEEKIEAIEKAEEIVEEIKEEKNAES